MTPKQAKELIRRTIHAEKQPISAVQVKEARDRIPGLSLNEAIDVATSESGRLCDDSRDEVILALMVTVTELRNQVSKLSKHANNEWW